MCKKLLFLVLFASTDLFAQRSLHLSIGDPARKDKEARLVLDAITATASGELLTPRDLAARLSDRRLIFIGESHTSIEFHKAQLRVIEELKRAGKRVFIGLEMYPVTEQKVLNDWTSGLFTENGFIQLSSWYKNWGYHWNYYRDIFLLARDQGMRLFALNAPREIVSSVTRRGLEKLTPAEKSQIAPKIDVSNEEHFALFKSYFEEETGMHSMMTDAQARAMFASQCTWDATMGYNAVRALKEYGGQDAVVVVLIGSGHVAYGLGIQRQSAQWYEGKMASIIPVEVADDKDAPISSVRASFADYIWGVPREKDPLYPELGTATVDLAPGDYRRKIVSVGKNSPAALAGLKPGGVLISMDGSPLTDREDLNRLMSEKRWGDSAELLVSYPANDPSPPGQLSSAPPPVAGGSPRTVTVYFRRQNPTAKQSPPGN